ncbi:hypothetical protein FV139_15800 [Parahaliea maris]|uniref:Uncharacterized protein n=2 Tax=Parahaliea maris TaxID=2716870 RepID=A0A5C8ZWI2_9GAMM|nr:hypothetical protein FV139_15800 [Parahaliea maris]
MLVPPEWWAEAEEDTILVGDLDDVGCIEMSTLHKEGGVFDATEVLQIAGSETPGPLQWRKVQCGDFAGVSTDFVEDSAAIREWYLYAGAMLLFVTYSCDEENRGMDDPAVDEILDTLNVLNAS